MLSIENYLSLLIGSTLAFGFRGPWFKSQWGRNLSSFVLRCDIMIAVYISNNLTTHSHQSKQCARLSLVLVTTLPQFQIGLIWRLHHRMVQIQMQWFKKMRKSQPDPKFNENSCHQLAKVSGIQKVKYNLHLGQALPCSTVV